DPDTRFYFVHSYGVREWELRPGEGFAEPVVTWAEHGVPFVAAGENGPLMATQFHPQKSGDAGAALLRNWLGTLEEGAGAPPRRGRGRAGPGRPPQRGTAGPRRPRPGGADRPGAAPGPGGAAGRAAGPRPPHPQRPGRARRRPRAGGGLAAVGVAGGERRRARLLDSSDARTDDSRIRPEDLMSLVLLPAVDVAYGQAVRLVQGEAGTETGYGEPLAA